MRAKGSQCIFELTSTYEFTKVNVVFERPMLNMIIFQKDDFLGPKCNKNPPPYTGWPHILVDKIKSSRSKNSKHHALN